MEEKKSAGKVNFILLFCILFSLVAQLTNHVPFLVLIWAFIVPPCFIFCTRNAPDKKYLLLTDITLALCFTILMFGFYYGWYDFPIHLLDCSLIYIAFLGDRFVHKKSKSFAATLVFPALYVLLELLIQHFKLGTNFKYDSYIYAFPQLFQSIHLTGPYGISFICAWSAPCIIYFIDNFILNKNKSAENNWQRWLVFICPVLFAALTVYGTIRLRNIPEPKFNIKAAYAAGPYCGDYKAADYLPFEENTATLKQVCKTAGEKNIHLVTFTEDAFLIDYRREEEFISIAKEQAVKYKQNILLGFDLSENENGKNENKIVFLDADGNILVDYTKNMLIPIVESFLYEEGDGKIPFIDLTIDGHPVRLSFVICYDSDIPEFTYKINSETDILLVPSWDWKAIKNLHNVNIAYISVLKDVTIFKPTYDGISIVMNPYGQITAQSDTAQTGFGKCLFTELPVY